MTENDKKPKIKLRREVDIPEWGYTGPPKDGKYYSYTPEKYKDKDDA